MLRNLMVLRLIQGEGGGIGGLLRVLLRAGLIILGLMVLAIIAINIWGA